MSYAHRKLRPNNSCPFVLCTIFRWVKINQRFTGFLCSWPKGHSLSVKCSYRANCDCQVQALLVLKNDWPKVPLGRNEAVSWSWLNQPKVGWRNGAETRASFYKKWAVSFSKRSLLSDSTRTFGSFGFLGSELLYRLCLSFLVLSWARDNTSCWFEYTLSGWALLIIFRYE